MRPSIRDQYLLLSILKSLEATAEPAPRKIVRVVTKSPDWAGAELVELECGHTGYALGTEMAGCPRCAEESPGTEGRGD